MHQVASILQTVFASIAVRHGYGKHIGDIPKAALQQALFVFFPYLTSSYVLLTVAVLLRLPDLLQADHLADENLDSSHVSASLLRYPCSHSIRPQLPIVATDLDDRGCRHLRLHFTRRCIRMLSSAVQLGQVH